MTYVLIRVKILMCHKIMQDVLKYLKKGCVCNADESMRDDQTVAG